MVSKLFLLFEISFIHFIKGFAKKVFLDDKNVSTSFGIDQLRDRNNLFTWIKSLQDKVNFYLNKTQNVILVHILNYYSHI